MATKNTLKGVIKSRKPRTKIATPRRRPAQLRPAPTAQDGMGVVRAAGKAAIKAENAALRALWDALKGEGEQDAVTVTKIAKHATEYVGELEGKLLEMEKELVEAEAGRRAAEKALEEEIATREEGAQQYAWSRE